jgi:two-component system chemotaxis response regulator CheB
MIRVLIVDDSAVVRKALTLGLAQFNDIEVVGGAADPYIARDKIVRLKPDVITLDLHMPRMDGLSFLTKLMRYYPLPVVVVSSLTPRDSQTALRALELGAVEVICKPGATAAADIAAELAWAIRAAAAATIRPGPAPQPQPPSGAATGRRQGDQTVIAIGASTGGTLALEFILQSLPPDIPGIAIVQHMPERFTAAFAQRLNSICRIDVREAVDDEFLAPGQALVAPGGKHLIVERAGGRYRARVKDGPLVHHQRPSVDVLFQSVAGSAGSSAVGVLLTGMGVDGARGLLAMRERGAHTIAQDEASSVVFGMPAEAIRLRAACEVAGLDRIPDAILQRFPVATAR